jgi:hypothetical protein
MARCGGSERFVSSVLGNHGRMARPTPIADITDAAEQRRLAREKRRDPLVGVSHESYDSPRLGGTSNEIADLRHSVAELLRDTSPRAAATLGAVVLGMVAGLVTAARRTNDKDGNVISGDVAVHLLNRVELLTIRLQVRHARRDMPTEIDVHRVEAHGSSRASSPS